MIDNNAIIHSIENYMQKETPMAHYLIIADSSCELPEEYQNDPRFSLVPFYINIEDNITVDTPDIDIPKLIEDIAASRTCPKSSCPSPEAFLKLIEESDAKNIYIITISSHLSGCHNSAMLAMNTYNEEHDDKNILVVDSESASCGESQLALKAMEYEEEGLSFEEISSKLLNFRDTMSTYCVIDNLETLRKNGRLSKVSALAASTLNIKPLLMGVKGELEAAGKTIGLKKAWNMMVDRIVKDVTSDSKTTDYLKSHFRLIITHCNNQGGAEKVADMLKERAPFIDYVIMHTSGLSTLYANDGGIIVTY